MKILNFIPKDSINAKSHRKENNFYKEFQLVVFDKETNKFHVPLQIRVYATNAIHSACVWFNHNELHATGSSRAGGYGYHRESQAISDALIGSGFEFERGFGGTGQTEKAIETIAEYFKFENYTVLISQG